MVADDRDPPEPTSPPSEPAVVDETGAAVLQSSAGRTDEDEEREDAPGSPTEEPERPVPVHAPMAMPTPGGPDDRTPRPPGPPIHAPMAVPTPGGPDDRTRTPSPSDGEDDGADASSTEERSDAATTSDEGDDASDDTTP